MAEPMMKVRIDSSGIRAMLRKLSAFPHHPAVTKMLNQWAVRYRRFTRRRFARYSKGGGDWAALDDKTIYRRRHGAGARFKRGKRAYRKALATGGGQVSILRDTGTLFNALEPVFANAPGAWEEEKPMSIEVGFGGPGRHPKGKATIADIASFHQFGGPNLPQREILVDPDEAMMRGMQGDGERALTALVRDSQIRGKRVG